MKKLKAPPTPSTTCRSTRLLRPLYLPHAATAPRTSHGLCGSLWCVPVDLNTTHLTPALPPGLSRPMSGLHEECNTRHDERDVGVLLERVLLPQEGAHDHHGDGLAALA